MIGKGVAFSLKMKFTPTAVRNSSFIMKKD